MLVQYAHKIKFPMCPIVGNFGGNLVLPIHLALSSIGKPHFLQISYNYIGNFTFRAVRAQ